MSRIKIIGFIGVGLLTLGVFLPLTWISGYDGVLLCQLIITASTGFMFVSSEMFSGLIMVGSINTGMIGLCYTVFLASGPAASRQISGLLTPLVTLIGGNDFSYNAINGLLSSHAFFSYLSWGPNFSFAIVLVPTLVLIVTGIIGHHYQNTSIPSVTILTPSLNKKVPHQIKKKVA